MAEAVPLLDRMAAIAAWASTATGFAAVAVAISQAPWFSWTENALSDLGHPSHASQGAFNVGLAAAGFLNLVFVSVLWGKVAPNLREFVAVLCLKVGSLSLALIGIFNESYGRVHLLVSFTYFAFIPAGMALFAPAAARADARLGRLSLLIAVAAALLGISIITAMEARTPFTSQAIPELLASIIFGTWTCWAGLLLWKGARFRTDKG